MQALSEQGTLILYNFIELVKKWSFGVRMIKILPFCQPDYNSLQNVDTNQFD